MKKFISYSAAFLFALVTLSACSLTRDPEAHGQSQVNYSAISSSSEEFSPKKGEQFTWYKNGITWAISAHTPQHEKLGHQLLEELEIRLAKHGLKRSSRAADADYVLGVAILDNQTSHTEEISSFFQLAPGLAAKKDSLNATVIVAAIENTPLLQSSNPNLIRHNLIWRTAIETNVLKEATDQERLARVSELAEIISQHFPDARE